MIITRSPLRISLGGGGTDLPSFYRQYGGFVIAAAIDKYVYIALHETFRQQIILKYSRMEVVETVEQIRHPIVREALRMMEIENPHLEIASMSDIPSGTGLGSSGSFTTALLRALHAYRKNFIPREQLAEQACRIEIDLLKEPVGKQDQYIASFGGLTCLTIDRSGEVFVEPLKIPAEALHNLEDNLLLFFTGFTRSASDLLRDQDRRSRDGDREMLANLHFIKELGLESRAALEAGDLRRYAELMHIHWQHKKRRTPGMSNSCIDRYYELARDNGALGGKLIGAGGGGFLMFYSEHKTHLRRVLCEAGLREVRLRVDFSGTTVISQT